VLNSNVLLEARFSPRSFRSVETGAESYLRRLQSQWLASNVLLDARFSPRSFRSDATGTESYLRRSQSQWVVSVVRSVHSRLHAPNKPLLPNSIYIRFGFWEMTARRKNDDCYYYYRSACSRDDKCLFRHEPLALGCRKTCSFWQRRQSMRETLHFPSWSSEKTSQGDSTLL
jgi:hypothetical protein